MSDVTERIHRDDKGSDFERAAKADKLHLLFDQSFSAVFVSVANASFLLIILWRDTSHQRLLTWYAAIVVASVLRTVLFMNYRIRAPKGDAVLAWEAPYFGTLVVSALVWRVGGLWLIVDAPEEYQLTIFFFLIGMAGGAISVYSAIRTMVLATVGSVLMPATAWFLVFGDGAGYYAAMGSTLFLMSCVRSTKILSAALHQSFLLGHELNHAKVQAEAMARTDSLTGLNNRAAFHDLVESQMRYCGRHALPASLIALDLDDFKKINDNHGHGAGDEALRQVAQLMLRNTRSSDLCGRMGGEEFMVFLPNTGLDDAVNVAEKIRDAFVQYPVQHDETTVSVTASFGVATGVRDLDGLLSLADRASYNAKEDGKNCIHRCSGTAGTSRLSSA